MKQRPGDKLQSTSCWCSQSLGFRTYTASQQLQFPLARLGDLPIKGSTHILHDPRIFFHSTVSYLPFSGLLPWGWRQYSIPKHLKKSQPTQYRNPEHCNEKSVPMNLLRGGWQPHREGENSTAEAAHRATCELCAICVSASNPNSETLKLFLGLLIPSVSKIVYQSRSRIFYSTQLQNYFPTNVTIRRHEIWVDDNVDKQIANPI